MFAIVVMTEHLQNSLHSSVFDADGNIDFAILKTECETYRQTQKQQHQQQFSHTLNPDIINACVDNLHPKLNLSQNPTPLTNPYWQWIVRHQLNPDQILDVMPHLDEKLGEKRNYGESSPTDILPPLWSFQRMGQSETHLPDGRVIFIGGEFDDYYDPNFCIFNDVVVKYPNGEIEIYGYPLEIFPPTDFHTATLIGDEIYIIGNMGYFDQRQYSATAMYKLNIHSLKIQRVESRNHIGWINNHTASVEYGQIMIQGGRIFDDDCSPMRENIDIWAFNLKTLVWQNITQRQWQGFWLHRKDFDTISASKYHSALLYEYLLDNHDILQNELNALQQHLGEHFNYALYKQLFKPPIQHSDVILNIDNYHEVVIYVLDDIKIRYVFDDDYLQVYIEGQLSDEQLEIFQANICHTLSKLEQCPCDIKLLPFHTPFGWVKAKAKKVKRT